MNEMIPGIDFDFGAGRVYTLPPLTMGAMERLQKGLTAMNTSDGLDAQTITTAIDATHAALRRNYPSMTRDDVAELIDISNFTDVLSAVMDVAGLKRKAKAETEKNPQAQQTMAETPALTGQP